MSRYSDLPLEAYSQSVSHHAPKRALDIPAADLQRNANETAWSRIVEQKFARKEYSFLSIEKTIGNSMSLARSSSTCAGELLGWSRPRLLLEDAPRPSRRVRDPAVGCLGAGMYQRGRVHGAPPLLAPLRSRRRRLRPAPNYGAAPQAGGLERPAGCTDGLCVCAQLDLLYDVIRIQAQNQATILADVQALCVRQAPLAPLKPRRPCREAAPEPRLLLAGLHGRGHVLHVGVGDPGEHQPGRRLVNHG